MGVINKLLRLCLLLVCCSPAWAETTSRTVQTAIGESFRHTYEDGVPVLVKNSHIVVELAGYQLSESSPGVVSWRWSFTLLLGDKPPVSIAVSDVSKPHSKLLVSQDAGVFTRSRWFGRSEQFLPTPENLPWLYDSGSTQRVFRLDMMLSDGSHKVVYQPTLYTDDSKRKIRRLIKQGSISSR